MKDIGFHINISAVCDHQHRVCLFFWRPPCKGLYIFIYWTASTSYNHVCMDALQDKQKLQFIWNAVSGCAAHSSAGSAQNLSLGWNGSATNQIMTRNRKASTSIMIWFKLAGIWFCAVFVMLVCFFPVISIGYDFIMMEKCKNRFRRKLL